MEIVSESDTKKSVTNSFSNAVSRLNKRLGTLLPSTKTIQTPIRRRDNLESLLKKSISKRVRPSQRTSSYAFIKITEESDED